MKILLAMTENTAPIKTLVEVLKELLTDTNIEFIADDPTTTESEKKPVKQAKPKKKAAPKKGKLKDVPEEEEEILSEEELENTETKKKSKAGMKILAVDPTKTVLVHLKLDAENFQKFECKKKKLTLGVGLGNLHKFIKTMEKDSNLTLYVDSDNENYLKIKIDNQEAKKEQIHELKLMDLPDERIDVPETSFDVVVTMESQEFYKICREMNSIAEHVDIKCTEKKITFTCKGDVGKSTLTYSDDGTETSLVRITMDKKGKSDAPLVVHGIYELRILALFSKCFSLCPQIEIYMKDNYPLAIKYTVGSLGRILLCCSPIKEGIMKTGSYSEDEDDEYYRDQDIELIDV